MFVAVFNSQRTPNNSFRFIQPCITNFTPSGITNFYPTRYYQWVGFVLLLQGILFLGPYMLWKFLEGGRVIHIHNVIWAVIENIILT